MSTQTTHNAVTETKSKDITICVSEVYLTWFSHTDHKVYNFEYDKTNVSLALDNKLHNRSVYVKWSL